VFQPAKFRNANIQTRNRAKAELERLKDEIASEDFSHAGQQKITSLMA